MKTNDTQMNGVDIVDYLRSTVSFASNDRILLEKMYQSMVKAPEPLLNNNIRCPHCGNDSGYPEFLHMVIPPEGLCCYSCGKVCVQSTQVTC